LFVKKLIEKFGYTNPMQVPRIDKIVLNMGVGDAVATPSWSRLQPKSWPRSPASARPSPRPAKSIATFKLREGMDIGAKVTLRKATDVRVS
jgi:large subunit ribosomal protein L5